MMHRSGVGLESALSCRSTTIVGGLSMSPGVTQNHGVHQRISIASPVLIAAGDHYSEPRLPLSTLSSFESNSLSPPHRYLLLSTLLI